MSEARKYAFDTEFAADGSIVRDTSGTPRARLSMEEVEAERAEAFKLGQKDAFANAERAAAEAAQAFVGAAQTILGRLDDESRLLRAEAAHLALATARQIAGAALDAFGAERAIQAAEKAMEALPASPRLIVRVAPALVDDVRKRLEAAAKDHAFGGAVLIKPDEAIAVGDVTLDWQEGVIAYDRKEIAARAAALIEKALAAPPETEE